MRCAPGVQWIKPRKEGISIYRFWFVSSLVSNWQLFEWLGAWSVWKALFERRKERKGVVAMWVVMGWVISRGKLQNG